MTHISRVKLRWFTVFIGAMVRVSPGATDKASPLLKLTTYNVPVPEWVIVMMLPSISLAMLATPSYAEKSLKLARNS